MATKLKNLKVTSVDFVDEGANPDAYIKLYKRREGSETGEVNKGADHEDVPREEIGAWKKVLAAIAKALGIEEDDDEQTEKCNDLDKCSDDVKKESDDEDETKGDVEMKVDKSRMTPAERAFYEEIEKRYAVEDSGSTTDDIKKGAAPEAAAADKSPSEESADVYKGLSPEVKAELENLKKFREEAEDRELRNVAKNYEIIGKKEEELFPVLKSLKAAGGTAYNDMIAILDQTKEVVEKSGAFKDIGKNGGQDAGSSAWARAEAKAAEIMKTKTVSKAKALDEVFIADPALAAECEKEV